jgi:homoserine dehydrogenase
MIKIGLLGLGTVGQGVYEIISQKNSSTVDGDALLHLQSARAQ